MKAASAAAALWLVAACACVLLNSALAAQATAHSLPHASLASYYAGYPSTKTLCLRHKAFSNFAEAGCGGIDNECTSAGGSSCPGGGACITDYMLQSELTCCRDEYGEYAAESDSALDSLKIGACEWHFAFYQCPDGYAAAGLCGIDTLNTTDTSLDGYILTPSGSLQIGSAWATCGLNSDAETCGDDLCGQLMLNFQGTLHVVEGYFDYEQLVAMQRTNSGAERQTRSGRAQQPSTVPGLGSSVLKAVQHTPLGVDIAKRYPTAYNPTAFKNRRGTAGKVYVPGVAVMSTGPVRITSMGRSWEWNSGMLEYVLAVEAITLEPTSHLPPGARVIVADTYTLAMGSASNGDGDGPGYENDNQYGEEYAQRRRH